MLDRWWPAILLIGIGLVALAWPFYSDLYVRLTAPWQWRTMAGLGCAVILVSLVMLVLRKSAYVRPMSGYLLLATPFLRMKISYRRIRKASTNSIGTLFPPNSVKGLKREIIEPFWSNNAVVLDLTSLPISASALRLFLSPFFFKDKTPHLVILVKDWMRFSTELESFRVGGDEPAPVRPPPSESILARLPRK
jgi:hypothetical protein